MHIHALIHAPFEKLGVIETWISQKKYHLSTTHTYKGELLPQPNTFDFLIIMGGPQSALQLERYPYLRDEILLAKQVIQLNKPLLGICLGAQILGEALGADAEISPEREVGMYPIEMTKEGRVDPVFQLFPEKFNVMHWHNDMPGLASDAVILARSEGCSLQAFRYGDRVYGFQFHLELTSEIVRGMVEHCPNDLLQGKYVRTRDELLSTDYQPMHEKLMMVLDYLSGKIHPLK